MGGRHGGGSGAALWRAGRPAPAQTRCGHELGRNASFTGPLPTATLAGHFTTAPSKDPAVTITAINVRNQFRGRIREIIEGPVLSEVDVETPSGQIVTSVITTRSVRELGLVTGKEVIALVKATEVSLATL